MSSPFLEAIDLVRRTADRHGFLVALIGGFALPFHGLRRATGDVDFLIEASGAEPLHDALTTAGYEALHRTADVANYRAADQRRIPIDVLYAKRTPAIAMLKRAVTPATGVAVRVVDVEGLIGLKLQAMTNDPRRRRQDESDIVALLAANLPSLNRDLLGEYFGLFDARDELARFLEEAQRRRG